MINVSILGCCVLRDVIEFEDTKNVINVDKFVQFINPITVFGGQVVLSEDIFAKDNLQGSGFATRCMKIDLQKNLFQQFEEVKSDYILLDISDMVAYFYQFDNGISFTESRGFKDNEAIVLKAMGYTKEELEKYRRGLFDLSVNEIKAFMKLYAKKILSMYSPKQIILVEIYMAEKYVDPDSGLPVQWWNSMVPTHSQNCMLKVAYENLKDELGNQIHTIAFPKETYGKVNHKWGKYQRHYHDEYYKYLWDELMKIMNPSI